MKPRSQRALSGLVPKKRSLQEQIEAALLRRKQKEDQIRGAIAHFMDDVEKRLTDKWRGSVPSATTDSAVQNDLQNMTASLIVPLGFKLTCSVEIRTFGFSQDSRIGAIFLTHQLVHDTVEVKSE